MVRVEKINNIQICYEDNPNLHIKDYYFYCLNLLKENIEKSNSNINIIFGKLNWVFDNYNPIYRFDLQIEHTLVKDGGRGVNEKIVGAIEYEFGKNYLVRLIDSDYFNSIDFIIEYSMPNVVNITKSKAYKQISNKLIYIPPATFDVHFSDTYRDKIISTFSNNGSQRRITIEEKMKQSIYGYENITNCFMSNDLINLYDKTKILINIHQTDYHHTFEELRVFPAISRGVIVISENVPLKEYIPYNDLIIWCDYNNVIEKTLEVINNYKEIYNNIYNQQSKEKLLDLIDNNKIKINNLNLWKRN
jgi:hypothetical protein